VQRTLPELDYPQQLAKLFTTVCKIARNEVEQDFNFDEFFISNKDDLIILFTDDNNPISYLMERGESDAVYRLFHLVTLIPYGSTFYTGINFYNQIKKIYNQCMISELEKPHSLLAYLEIDDSDSNKDFIKLSNALRNNTCLKKLVLLGDLSNQQREELIDIIAKNISIKELTVGEFIFNWDYIEKLHLNTTITSLIVDKATTEMTLLPTTYIEKYEKLLNLYTKRNQLLALSKAYNMFVTLKFINDDFCSDIQTYIMSFVISDMQLQHNELFSPYLSQRNTLTFWKPFEPQQYEMFISDRVRHRHSVHISFFHLSNRGLTFYYLSDGNVSQPIQDFTNLLKNHHARSENGYDIIWIKSFEDVSQFFKDLNISDKQIQEIFEHYVILPKSIGNSRMSFIS